MADAPSPGRLRVVPDVQPWLASAHTAREALTIPARQDGHLRPLRHAMPTVRRLSLARSSSGTTEGGGAVDLTIAGDHTPGSDSAPDRPRSPGGRAVAGDADERSAGPSADRATALLREQERRPGAAAGVRAAGAAAPRARPGGRRPGGPAERTGRVREDAAAGGLGALRRGAADSMGVGRLRRQRPSAVLVRGGHLVARVVADRRARRPGRRDRAPVTG